MRCLIFGGDGMLGHQLLKSWRDRHDVRVTLRGGLADYRQYGLFHAENSFPDLDVRDIDAVRRALISFRPHAVVNAVGLIKQREAAKQALPSLEINAVFPHRLRMLCQELEIRMIQISTDCVFDGRRGGYREEDRCDPEDAYGMTKLLGEVGEPPAVTLRTSIIGRELSRKQSLVEWFLAQRGEIRGYTGAIYTGLTTLEMARVIEHVLLAHPALSGVWQVASAPISKFDLLTKLSARLGRTDITIVPDDRLQCDRSLIGTAFSERTGYQPPDWDAMLQELADHIQNKGSRNAAA